MDKLRRSLGQFVESQGCHSFKITRTLPDHEAGLVFPLSSQRVTSQQRTWHTKVDFIHHLGQNANSKSRYQEFR